MSKNLERRLHTLETHQEAVETAHDGYAPEAWTRLAPWALQVHDVGGWEAAVAAARAGTLPIEGNPYAGQSGGPLWDVVVFWQRGDQRHVLSEENNQFALQVIALCVRELLSQGMSREEVMDWRTGRMVWNEVTRACQEQEYPE